MAAYFASDMHLRDDRPERSRRLARWAGTLGPGDELYLAGDVCDFWHAARERRRGGPLCPGLQALADFRHAGGRLTILPGNHDHALGPFYRAALGAEFVDEPLDVTAYGLRIRVVHGHKVGGRPRWKRYMETRAFLAAFASLPEGAARRLDSRLDATNDLHRRGDERHILPYFYEQAAEAPGPPDVTIFGHIHTPLDDAGVRPRLIVLGGWQTQASYFKVDERGGTLAVVTDPA